MNRATAKTQLEKLRGEIQRHNRLYYLDANPEISDAQYDQLYRQLETLEAEFPDLVTSDSPTQRVGGGPIDGFEQVQHAVPMLSIDDVFSDQELTEFFLRLQRNVMEASGIFCLPAALERHNQRAEQVREENTIE